MVMGLGAVNGDRFAEDKARVAVMAYDYTVLAGTQELAQSRQARPDERDRRARWRLPTVFFEERRRRPACRGGGFVLDSSSAGPAVGRCAAGRDIVRALLRRQCGDPRLLRRDHRHQVRLGMGGPAMVEGGEASACSAPRKSGRSRSCRPGGTIDVLADDEAHAVKLAKQYLSYFQGPVADWTCADQRLLRQAIPENRLRVYDIRKVIELIADEGSVLGYARSSAWPWSPPSSASRGGRWACSPTIRSISAAP